MKPNRDLAIAELVEIARDMTLSWSESEEDWLIEYGRDERLKEHRATRDRMLRRIDYLKEVLKEDS